MAEPIDPPRDSPTVSPTVSPRDSPTDLPATDADGRSVDVWLAAVLARGADGPVAVLTEAATRVADPDVLAVRSRAARPDGVLARAGELPFRDNALAEVRALLCLPGVAGLDTLFAELRRVLRPAGTLVALVPARPRGSPTEIRAWWPLHRALGGAPRFRNDSARDRLGWLFASADFAVLVEQRRTFWLPVPHPDSAAEVVSALVRSGIWPGGLPTDRLAAVTSVLAAGAGPGRKLPVPLRLLIGRR